MPNEKPTNPEAEPLDISHEFLSMAPHEFEDFLLDHKDVPAVAIILDLTDINDERKFQNTMRTLKSFLEMFARPRGADHYTDYRQKRSASVRCSEKQYLWELNAFASGVKWVNSEKDE